MSVKNAVIGALRVNLGLDTAQFEAGVKQAQASVGGLGKLLSSAFVVTGLTAFAAGVGTAVGRIEEMRKLSAQLDRTIENTGNTAKTSASEVEAFADKIERATGRAAEEVMAVSTNLATFGFGRDTFYRAIELANDMAAAWGGDLRQNIEGLGRALADPEKGLAMLVKRGITFDDQQKAQIANFMKVNDLAGAQGVIFEALEGQVKGVAEAGFGGLTKATANLQKSVEDLFEKMASGLGVNSALEVSLTALGSAVDFVAQNFDTIARAAAVVGTAVLTAMGPVIWSTMTTAAVAFGGAAVGAIRAVGLAVASNPIGFLVTALAAAVSAVFLFRDEIAQAIGVDVAGVIIDVANKLIGSFKGSFESVAAIWSALPAVLGDVTISTANAVIDGLEFMINAAIGLMNDMFAGVREAMKMVGIEIGTIGNVDFTGISNKWEGAVRTLGSDIQRTMSEAMSGDYLGDAAGFLGTIFAGGDEAVTKMQALAVASDQTAEALGGVGSAGKSAGTQIAEGLDTAIEKSNQFIDALQSGVSGAISGIVKDGIAGKNVLDGLIDKVGDLAGRLLDMAIDGAIQNLFASLGGIGMMAGGQWNIPTSFVPGGFFPGLATGGRVMSGGLVEVGERGRELLNLPRGASVIRSSDVGAVRAAQGLKVNVINPPAQPRISQNGDGSLDIVFDQVEQRIKQNMARGSYKSFGVGLGTKRS